VKSHAVPLQVGAAPAGAVHAAHDVGPQLFVLVLLTQLLPYWCTPPGA
jgi:hypothetical protein